MMKSPCLRFLAPVLTCLTGVVTCVVPAWPHLMCAAAACAHVQGQGSEGSEMVVRRQEADGRWSAARYDGNEAMDARVTSLCMLALMCYESWIKSDSILACLSKSRAWLASQQDHMGRIGFRDTPEWLLDHAIACCALSEAMRLDISTAGQQAVLGKALDVLAT